MKFIKRSSGMDLKISLILLDWSVRESFHLLYYLSKQRLPRNQFEVIVIEYYSSVSAAIKKFDDQVDTWLLLEMPKNCYYHKHLMYNVGIAMAKGEILIICDSDAMVKPSFLESVLLAFQNNSDIVLHLDQFRNHRKDLYPFCFPSFEEVIGTGCINNIGGKTKGIVLAEDPLHECNYGACLCAKRADLLRIGGADEHIDFIGHICGPYDLTFRLINSGKKEVWHQDEFLYHTWHPGQAGVDNYLGPHDGRHMSTTALEALYSRRTAPHVTNPVMKFLNDKDKKYSISNLEKFLISSENLLITPTEFLESNKSKEWAKKTYLYFTYLGYQIVREDGQYRAGLILNYLKDKSHTLKSSQLDFLKREIRSNILHSILDFSKFFYLIKYFFENLKKHFLNFQKKYKIIVKLQPKISNKFSIIFKYKLINYFINNLLIFVLFFLRNFYFIKEILRKYFTKIVNIFIEKKLNVNYLISLLVNLSCIDKPRDNEIFLFINSSFIGYFLISFSISFLNKEFITVQKIKNDKELQECLMQLHSREKLSYVIVSRACFLQFQSNFLQVQAKLSNLSMNVI